MVNRPETLNSFEFIALAALRTAQLMRGCVPRVTGGHKPTTTAQLEIIAGKILKARLLPSVPLAAPPVADTEKVPEGNPAAVGGAS
jgi:DNA-directed RNA polymerase subunit K/omega